MVIRYNTGTDFTMNSAWIFRVFVCNQCQSSPSTPIFACVGFTLVILLFYDMTPFKT